MKTVLLAALALNLMTCDFLNTYNMNDNSPNGGSPTGPSGPCEGLIGGLSVDSESGSSVKVGRTITFSANPQSTTGGDVPAACKVGPVQASPIGECVPASTLSPTLEAIEMYARDPGECKVRVTFAGVTGTSEAVTIVP